MGAVQALGFAAFIQAHAGDNHVSLASRSHGLVDQRPVLLAMAFVALAVGGQLQSVAVALPEQVQHALLLGCVDL